MLNLVLTTNKIPAMTHVAIDNVRQLEAAVLKVPQTKIPTDHVFHAGVYARTIMIPAGVVLTGALIKKATLLILSGDAVVYVGDNAKEVLGYHVFAASANRKQAFVARSDTYLTMVFATDLQTVDEVEDAFTDEAEFLFSRKEDAVNNILVTGE